MTTEHKLIRQIMNYWQVCAFRDNVSDIKINTLLEDYALSCGIVMEKLEADIFLTVKSMTNSQKRKLYKLMLESGIR